jgi:stalled ribosome rescue protein Dom34
MSLVRKIGVWMDHSSAHLIEFAMENEESKTLTSAFTHEQKEKTWGKNENLMHNKEQHQQAAYYKNLAEAIKGYDEVLLFGPTNAKHELYNYLKKDAHFSKTIIDVEDAGKMSENQQQAFVRNHFAKKIIRF